MYKVLYRKYRPFVSRRHLATAKRTGGLRVFFRLSFLYVVIDRHLGKAFYKPK